MTMTMASPRLSWGTRRRANAPAAEADVRHDLAHHLCQLVLRAVHQTVQRSHRARREEGTAHAQCKVPRAAGLGLDQSERSE